jgi:PleD family two-component response regulator
MRRATLLVADRNPRFLEKTAEILDETGHEMVAATDGRTAQGLIQGQTRPRTLDGLMVHAALPGLSGFSLCRLVKESDPSLPVVIMFSSEDERGEAEARRAGADNWIIRPLKRTELLYVVRDIIALRAAHKHAESALKERDAALREVQGAVGSESGRLIQFELFKRLLGIELKRSQRYGFPLGLLVASLDRPPSADNRDILAAAARSAIRDIDIPVAFAQSDVMVVMPHTDLAGAQLVAERVRKRVRAAQPGGLTASIGIVSVDGGERISFSTLLAQATRAKRNALKAGGDRVVAA